MQLSRLLEQRPVQNDTTSMMGDWKQQSTSRTVWSATNGAVGARRTAPRYAVLCCGEACQAATRPCVTARGGNKMFLNYENTVFIVQLLRV